MMEKLQLLQQPMYTTQRFLTVMPAKQIVVIEQVVKLIQVTSVLTVTIL